MTKAKEPAGIAYSIVIPVYNEAEVLPTRHFPLARVTYSVGEPYEIIFVNDGGDDHSPMLLWDLQAKYERVKFLGLPRNIGHQITMTPGLDHSPGDAVVVMDAGLRDPTEVISRLIDQWRPGYDVVFALREMRRSEGFFKRVKVGLFYRLLRHLAATDIPLDAGDLRLMSRRTVQPPTSMRERNRFIRGPAGWVGFRQMSVLFVRDVWQPGETKSSLEKKLRFALNGIISLSWMPLQLATYQSFVASSISFAHMIYAVGLMLLAERVVLRWISVMVTVFPLREVRLISLGIIREYSGAAYKGVKQRPL